MRPPSYMRQTSRKDKRITIQQRGVTKDALGTPTDEWTALFSTKAQVYPAPGFERSLADGKTASLALAFIVRSSADTKAIKASYRIWMEDKAYNIVAPIDQPDRGGDIRIIAAADE